MRIRRVIAPGRSPRPCWARRGRSWPSPGTTAWSPQRPPRYLRDGSAGRQRHGQRQRNV